MQSNRDRDSLYCFAIFEGILPTTELYIIILSAT